MGLRNFSGCKGGDKLHIHSSTNLVPNFGQGRKEEDAEIETVLVSTAKSSTDRLAVGGSVGAEDGIRIRPQDDGKSRGRLI